MTESTVGRELVQIVQLNQPLCANTFGSAPCTATGGADVKCYNAFATCLDTSNYRVKPNGHLTADLSLATNDIIDGGDLTRSADLFAAFDVVIPSAATGIVWEQGAASNGIYLGFDSGNIVFSAGDGADIPTANTAVINVSASAILGEAVTLYAGIDVSAGEIWLWYWDGKTSAAVALGNDTAASGFPSTQWSGTGDGAIGTANGAVAGDYDETDFNGTINSALFYDSTTPPDMDAEYWLKLYFSRGRVAEQEVSGAAYIIPSLVNVSTASSKINLSGTSPDASGLGNRALATITMQDHPHSDRIVDPYLSGRSWDAFERGSFWTKWKARNKYRQNVPVYIYEGYDGQALSAMTVREYVLDSVQGPNAGGRVTIKCKDVLAKAEERKAQAPVLSPGRLYADITAVVTSFEAENAVIADYSASGTLRVDDEVMTYSARSATANGVTFTITTRGTDGTTAATHDTGALVQECLRFTDQNVDDVATTLLQTYARISAGFLDTANWALETDTYLTSFVLSTLITEPTAVSELMAELQEDTGCFFWWDDRESKVKMLAVKGITELPDLLTAEDYIVAGSFSLTEHPRLRLSQAWAYFDRRDPTESLSKTANYRFAQVQADLDAESVNEYGESQIKTIKSRWISTTAQALSVTSKIVTRYRDTPREVVFALDAKDRDYWIGDIVRLSHPLDVDAFGERNIANWFILAAEEIKAGHTIKYTAQDITLYGKITVIQANGSPDYQGDGSDPFTGAFIGDADGLLSDGTDCARIG